MEKKLFEQWCLVELMGHQQLAGLVSEAQFPSGFTRVDVYETDPDEGGVAVFTRIVSPSALYALNPVEKVIALEFARRLKAKPVQAYQLSNLLPASAAMARPSYPDAEDDREYEPGDDLPY